MLATGPHSHILDVIIVEEKHLQAPGTRIPHPTKRVDKFHGTSRNIGFPTKRDSTRYSKATMEAPRISRGSYII